MAGSWVYLNGNLKLQHSTRLFENKEWVSDLIFSIIYISALGSSHQLFASFFGLHVLYSGDCFPVLSFSSEDRFFLPPFFEQ
jgi:hypothetical protein